MSKVTFIPKYIGGMRHVNELAKRAGRVDAVIKATKSDHA
jgi:hypothetical protein